MSKPQTVSNTAKASEASVGKVDPNALGKGKLSNLILKD